MRHFILYTITVLIWGSTWFAIELQLGVVPPHVSVVYRFSIAGLIMWFYCLWKKLPMKLDIIDHGFLILLAIGNFSINYVIMYTAQTYISSAMSSIAFSTLLLINIINTRLFFGKPIKLRTYLGSLLGLMGVIALFWNDIKTLNLSNNMLLGLSCALLGTLIVSFGNMISVRNSKKQLGILQCNAWGMSYGAIILAFIVIISGTPFTIDLSFSYMASLIYLALFGTVFAFATYFILLKEIGPEKASYVIVLFPVVAVIISTFFEGFSWHTNTIIGFTLVLTGNIVVLTSASRLKKAGLFFINSTHNKLSMMK